MNKTEVKQLIHENFGFAKNKIEIIDCDYRHQTGKPYWIDFYVCNILYSMVEEGDNRWELKIRKSYGTIGFGLHGYCKNCKSST